MPKISKIEDNIVTISGKYNYKQGELFRLAPKTFGFILSAYENEAKLLVLGDSSNIKTKVVANSLHVNLDKVDVFEGFFGSIISPWSNILFPEKKSRGRKIGEGNLDAPSPPLLDRVKLSKPLATGILAIDNIIPIGKGQRELIIGDRTTGKTSIALSTIINQRGTNVKTIYVAVGQKRNSVISTYNILKKFGAVEDVIIVFANPDSSSQQFTAPKIGMAMAEALAYRGADVLVVIDDLTKHANIYREISLSIGKNPGREAYPTDIFYQHSRLLERAGRFNEKYKNGSITCLPIVETVKGDIASSIPSNVISITDGQIFTSTEKFNNGLYPAVNIDMSVSRTGSAVQSKKIAKISKGLKTQYAMLSDVKKFADIAVDLSEELKQKIEDWEAINNLLLQFGYDGYSEEEMEIIIKLFHMKLLGNLKDSHMFSVAFREYIRTKPGAKKIIEGIRDGELKDKELEYALKTEFLPLIKIASGDKTDIITQREYDELKGDK